VLPVSSNPPVNVVEPPLPGPLLHKCVEEREKRVPRFKKNRSGFASAPTL
jgi:hypothetical protein